MDPVRGELADRVYEDTDGIEIDVFRYVDPNLSLPPCAMMISLTDEPPPAVSNWAIMRLQTIRADDPLQVGVYLDAVDSPELRPGPLRPELDVGFQNRGSSLNSGQFTIFEVTFTADYSKLLSLVLEFEKHGGGLPPALRGRLEYRADGLTSIPKPGPSGMIIVGVMGPSRRRRRSFVESTTSSDAEKWECDLAIRTRLSARDDTRI